MMKDEILNLFIKKMISENIEEEKFAQYIELLSKFLGYTDSDYKYNGTYLSQYTDAFLQMCEMLKKKDKIYRKIFCCLFNMGFIFEMMVDRSCFAKYSSVEEIVYYYTGIDFDKITSQRIEVKVDFKVSDDRIVFCKSYEDYEDVKLTEHIIKDIKKILNMRKGVKR